MNKEKLALEGGTPVRSEPLPLEFPGVHYMDEEEVEAAVRVLRSRSLFRHYGISEPREVKSFEAEFAAFTGARYALGVSSGTGALHTALSALGVGPGQEVIVPAYLWTSVLAAVVNHGAIPVLADIDDTFCLDATRLEERITDRTTGVILVHMSGAPGDAPAVREVTRRHGLFLVEDCAQCAGGSIGGRSVGNFGEVGVFSFQPNKNMTSGEGGCLITDNYDLYRRAAAAHDVGYARDASGRMIFDVPELRLWGRGYRLDELRAAVLRVQLKKLPATIAAMRRSKYRLRGALGNRPGLRLRRIPDPAGDTGAFLIVTFAEPDLARRVNQALRAEGIITFPQGMTNILLTSWGLHLYYNNLSLVERTSVDGRGFPWNLVENAGSRPNYAKGACPVADSLFERSLLLAIPSCLSERDEQDILHAFEKVLGALL